MCSGVEFRDTEALHWRLKRWAFKCRLKIICCVVKYFLLALSHSLMSATLWEEFHCSRWMEPRRKNEWFQQQRQTQDNKWTVTSHNKRSIQWVNCHSMTKVTKSIPHDDCIVAKPSNVQHFNKSWLTAQNCTEYRRMLRLWQKPTSGIKVHCHWRIKCSAHPVHHYICVFYMYLSVLCAPCVSKSDVINRMYTPWAVCMTLT